MRKIILTIIFLLVTLVLSGCGNERLFEVGDDVNTFNYAFIEVGNTFEKVNIKDRHIKNPNRIVIVPTNDSKVYYTNPFNIILLNE